MVVTMYYQTITTLKRVIAIYYTGMIIVTVCISALAKSSFNLFHCLFRYMNRVSNVIESVCACFQALYALPSGR